MSPFIFFGVPNKMLCWIICGLVIYASTIVMVNKQTGSHVTMDSNYLFTMLTFAIFGPISIILGSMIINDINNK